MKKTFFLMSSLLLACWACDSARVYEQYYDIPDSQWYIDSIQSFRFPIDDPSATYNIYYNVRNSVAYPYYNLYVTYYLLDSSGKQIKSGLQELLLMDSQTGKPLGDGLGDLFDHQVMSLPAFRFPAKGMYTFQIKQYMRKDPLPEIISVGIRVEKVGPPK